jgi:predicted Zn-dependent protease
MGASSLGAAYYSYSINDTENAQRILESYLKNKEHVNEREDVAALNLRALIAHQKKDYKDAIDQFNDAILHHPHFRSLRYNLGYVLIDKGMNMSQEAPMRRIVISRERATPPEAQDRTGWLAWLGLATAKSRNGDRLRHAARALHQMGNMTKH